MFALPWCTQAASAPDETLPFKQVIRDAQQASRANLGTLASGARLFMTNVGQISLDAVRRFRLPANGRAVLWIPGGATQLQVQSMVCVCSHEGGWPSWCRGCSAAAVGILLLVSHGEARSRIRQQYPHCMDSKAGEKVPRPLGETVHGTRPGEVVHFDYLHVGAGRSFGDDGLNEGEGYRYILNCIFSVQRELVCPSVPTIAIEQAVPIGGPRSYCGSTSCRCLRKHEYVDPA